MKKEEGSSGLFETIRRGKGIRLLLYRGFAATVFLAISLICFYRLTHLPTTCGFKRWAWIGLLAADLWFGMYWILTQASRWNLTYRRTFRDRLSQRYEDDLPGVDVFVCTADPTVEPPLMVVNTVLSVMGYDYPPEKLSVYLSDDAASELTYFALLEASRFAKRWIPFCKEFNIEPRSPATYFASLSPTHSLSTSNSTHFFATKKLYEDMKHRIESACKLGRVPDEIRSNHEGFAQWDSYSSSRDHNAIVQILVDREELKATDIKGNPMPTLVYMAREKRPDYFHNFKAGAMNALIRVSSIISDGDIILNVDCDMYSNNSEAIRDALCFFMDERRGHEIAFVQFPQNFDNVTKNELYSSSLRVISEVEFHGLDGCGGPLYIGTGCFHRRAVLCGKEFNGETNDSLLTTCTKREDYEIIKHHDTNELNSLVSCAFEKNTPWGIEKGLRYGVAVEDVITGLMIQCKGWKSVYYNPERKAFLGIGATTLLQALVMHKRWSEGDLQIFFSNFSPVTYGFGRLSPGLLMGYLTYCLWAPNCFATMYYVVVPSISLWKGISLFPEVSSLWFLPFAYVILATYSYSLAEFLMSGGTVQGWWNDQRMWVYKRTSSYVFAFIDTVVKLLGFSDTAFVISPKVTDDDVSIRYEKELMEFGAESPMLTMITTVAFLNLICFIGFGIKTATAEISSVEARSGSMFLQGMLCLVLILINLPIYQGVFFRKDGGKMQVSTGVTAIVIVASICSCFFFL